MKVGFTGTRKGMSFNQKQAFVNFLEEHLLEITELHHGDCVGADKESHDLFNEIYLLKGFDKRKTIIHPPANKKNRAFCEGIVLQEKAYLERNKDIIDSSDIIIAAPDSDIEKLRSGTWHAIRYAKKQHKDTIILPRI